MEPELGRKPGRASCTGRRSRPAAALRSGKHGVAGLRGRPGTVLLTAVPRADRQRGGWLRAEGAWGPGGPSPGGSPGLAGWEPSVPSLGARSQEAQLSAISWWDSSEDCGRPLGHWVMMIPTHNTVLFF